MAAFGKQAARKDGLFPWCRECVAAHHKAQDPALKRAASRKHYWLDPEKHRAKARERYAQDPELMQERCRRSRQKDPTASRRAAHERRARIKGASEIERIDREAVIARDKSICHICGKKVTRDITLDHLIPLSEGGPHTMANLRVAHRSCNSKRRDGRTDAQLLLIA